MLYLLVLIIGIFFSIVKLRSRTFFYSYLFILIIFASFRYGVGPDYFNYQFLYSLVNTTIAEQLSVGSGQEFLFRITGTILNNINFSYQQYLAIVALVTLYFIGKICNRYSPYPLFSLYLFFCFFYFVWVFSGIRQGLTLAIGVYFMLVCLEDRKHLKFVMIVFILTLIHASSLALLLFYFIANLNLGRKTLLIGVAICFCVSFIPHTMMMSFFSYFPYTERIEFYYRPEEGVEAINHFDFKSIARLILLLLFGVLLSPKRIKTDDIQYKIISIYLVSFSVYYSLRFVEILASNASMYGFLLIVLIIPMAIPNFKNNLSLRLYMLFCLLFSIVYFFRTLSSMEDYSKLKHNSLITPYTHIFNKTEYFPNEP